jgi:hypothetical protein
MAAARERFSEHITPATDTQARIEVMLETVFSMVVRAEEL